MKLLASLALEFQAIYGLESLDVKRLRIVI